MACHTKLSLLPFVSVTVKVRYFSSYQALEDIEVVEGDAVTLRVVVGGVPEPQCMWYKDGAEVRTTSDVMLTSDGDTRMLIMSTATPRHSGVYKCVATNTSGSSECEAKVVCNAVKVTQIIFYCHCIV